MHDFWGKISKTAPHDKFLPSEPEYHMLAWINASGQLNSRALAPTDNANGTDSLCHCGSWQFPPIPFRHAHPSQAPASST